mgnify:CR=1 FL=1
MQSTVRQQDYILPDYATGIDDIATMNGVCSGWTVVTIEHAAADIIGNFSTALAFRYLGRSSGSNDLKCSVFEQAFGEILDFSNFPATVIRNKDELALPSGSASFTFSISGADA